MKNATDDYETFVILRANAIHGPKWAFSSQPQKLLEQGNTYYTDPLPAIPDDVVYDDDDDM
jgi:hypothetical protein